MPYEPVENFRADILLDRSSYPIRDEIIEKAVWNNPLEIGNYFVWKNKVDSQLYKSETRPENDNDGFIVILQN